MKILYLSCHSILEHDEVKLFTELGHEVFAFGSYQNPTAPHDPKRPAIKGKINEYLLNVALQCSQADLHEKMIEWADLIMIMHKPDWVLSNWPKIKHKRVVLRTIGQNTPDIEKMLSIPKIEGLKIVRYSPEEQTIDGFAGQEAMIRFYKDPEEFCGYSGEIPAVLSVSQSMKERNKFCGYDIFMEASEGFHRNLYGNPSRNADLSLMDDPLWRGQLSYEELKDTYRKHRVYFYTGTYPASYTLNFIEAFMTGIPVVSIGRDLANIQLFKGMDAFEIDKIIENGVNGYISDSVEELREYISFLIENPVKAKEIGDKGRETAIELFGKEKIKKEWKEFLDSL